MFSDISQVKKKENKRSIDFRLDILNQPSASQGYNSLPISGNISLD